jgi:TonB family protein
MLERTKLTAQAAERLFRTEAETPADRLRFAGLLVLSAVLNIVVIYLLVLLTFIEAPPMTVAEEIPVEVVQEQPQETPPEPQQPEPQQPAPEEKQKPPQQTLDEEPATDAPKTQSDAKEERDATEARKSPPLQAKPTDQAAASPAPAREQTPVLRPSQAPPAAEQPQRMEPDAEAIENAAPPAQAKAEPEAQAPKQAPPKKGAMTNDELAAAFAPVPDYEFDQGPRKSPVGGGRSKTTYLTIVYGMIMPHMRTPASQPSQALEGMVSFIIDEWGHVARIGVSKPSGSPQLDMAAMAAIKSASPYPSPPNHMPIGLNFSYGSKRSN